MTEYIIYIEFFGKKLKTTVEAETVAQAKRQILDRVNFLKIEAVQPDQDLIVEKLQEMFNMK